MNMVSTCRYTQVQAGDGCWALADRCGISQSELVKWNNVPNFCSTLHTDQYVCCSSGALPDFSPKPNDHGHCFVHTVEHNDTCAKIAEANKMDADDISGYNDLTWGWTNCTDLQLGQNICLSKGTPPFPSAVEGVVCGPQVRLLACFFYLHW